MTSDRGGRKQGGEIQWRGGEERRGWDECGLKNDMKY